MDRLAKLTAALETDPQDAFLLYAIAQEHAKEGRHEQAVAFFDRTIEADRDSCYAYFHRALSLCKLGRDSEARDCIRAGIEAARRTGDGHAHAELTGLLKSLEP